MKPAYAIRYLTTLQNKPCSITLRGVFEDGKYYGDIIVCENRTIFTIEGNFNGIDTAFIYESISFFEKYSQPKYTEQTVDCWIACHPIQKQRVIFEHYVDYNYDKLFCHIYEKFISTINMELVAKSQQLVGQ